MDRVGPVESAIIRDAYTADELDRLERGTRERVIATVAGQSYVIRFIRPGFASNRRLGYSVEPYSPEVAHLTPLLGVDRIPLT